MLDSYALLSRQVEIRSRPCGASLTPARMDRLHSIELSNHNCGASPELAPAPETNTDPDVVFPY